MIKQIVLFSLSAVLLSILSCKTVKEYTDYCAPIRTDNMNEISFEFHDDTTSIITITDKREMLDFITELNNSKVNGPWKGANWDRIVLQYDDGNVKIFSTNGKVFGRGSIGTFYNLNNKYRHYWK